MRRIQREFDHRQSQAVSRGQAFNVAHDRARDDFFLELARGTRGVSGLPTTADASAADLRDASSAVVDALLRQRVAVDGLTTALASCAAARAVDHETDQEAAYTAVIAAAMLAPAPADRVETGPPPGATARATRALLGGGTAATVALVTGFVATAASPLIAAGALAWLVRRSRRQNDQLRIELDQAELNLVTTQRGFEAGMGLLAEATDILGYIAVHASHALRRWRATLPTAPAEWSDLGTDQQHAYTTFVEIAAHQVCVDSIDVTGLLAAPAQRQTALIEAAEAILAHARHKVELLV
jgi:hypothetical protein